MNGTTLVRDEIIYLGNDFIQMRAEEITPPQPEVPLRDTPPPLITNRPSLIDEYAEGNGLKPNNEPDQRDEVNDRTADA